MATVHTRSDAERDDGVIATLAATLAQRVTVDHPPNLRPATRDAHPKAHGCVRAIVKVDPALDHAYARGVFVPGQEYHAWIRFSNALNVRHDLVRDARGMAVKLLDVAGDNETPGCTSQDFLLVTHPAFFVATAREYVDFPAAVFRSYSTVAMYLRVGRFFFGLFPWRFRWRGAWALLRSLTWTSSPLVIPYFSQAPFRFGDNEAKFCVRPHQHAGTWQRLSLLLLATAYQITFLPFADRLFTFARWEHLLRDALWRSIRRRPASFDLCVQLREDDDAMPLDDATVRWSERRAPYRRVATIEIPCDQPELGESMALAEHLTFSPWHAVRDHRPLGSINEARRVVYDRIAALRHRENGVERREPRADETAAAYLSAIGLHSPAPRDTSG
jgi:hypothetical protein